MMCENVMECSFRQNNRCIMEPDGCTCSCEGCVGDRFMSDSEIQYVLDEHSSQKGA